MSRYQGQVTQIPLIMPIGCHKSLLANCDFGVNYLSLIDQDRPCSFLAFREEFMSIQAHVRAKTKQVWC